MKIKCSQVNMVMVRQKDKMPMTILSPYILFGRGRITSLFGSILTIFEINNVIMKIIWRGDNQRKMIIGRGHPREVVVVANFCKKCNH